MPKFSLCYTSRRAKVIDGVIETWLTRADKPAEVEVILTIDADDKEAQAIKFTESDLFKVYSQPSMPTTCVKGWNLAAEHATGDIFIAIADDFNPPEHWDTLLTNCAPEGWWNEDHAVHVNDGYVQTIMTLSIVTKKRYNRFGYFFYPQYKSMFNDTDFTQRAYQDGVVINAMHLMFEHLHCDNGKREKDALDVVHASPDRWKSGETLFHFRTAMGFPIDCGPRYKASLAALKLPIAEKYAAYIHAIKDDFCLKEVIDRLYEEGVRHFYLCIPDHYWNGNPVPSKDMEEVHEIADQVSVYDGIRVTTPILDVATHFKKGRSRIEVETRTRNDALSLIEGDGFFHVLVVDTDELWRRGLLKKLDAALQRFKPFSAKVGMVPVIGLPGYPVNAAKDTATLYISTLDRFKDCRAPWNGQQYFLEGYDILHFTGTRRTTQEIIDKMRDGGHYDDPRYDFEGWITNVLPVIKPGLKNVHMFTPYQIWPEVREWTKEEMHDIPESLHSYLGHDTSS